MSYETLAEQMGVGADDDRHDPHEAETPDPCRGCNSIHCAGECPEYRQWLTVAYLEYDAAMAERDAADLAEEPSRCDWCCGPHVVSDCADFKVGIGGDADARP